MDSYPKIYNLGHRALKRLLDGPVAIQEKVDGSQFSFGRYGSTLAMRSKGKELVVDAPEKLFRRGVEAVSQLDLRDGLTYRGELLDRPNHNALKYDRIPNNHVILFDISVGEADFLTPEEVKKEGDRIGLEVVPTFFYGELESYEHLTELLDTTSILGGVKIEGVVIKNYSQWDPTTGKTLMGKFVSEAFKEEHKKSWGESNPAGKDIITKIILRYKTEARWAKAAQHLRERGELEGSPRDIGNLIKEAQTDIVAECEEDIKDMLFHWAKPQVLRCCTSGLPEWYKQLLAMEQFNEEGL